MEENVDQWIRGEDYKTNQIYPSIILTIQNDFLKLSKVLKCYQLVATKVTKTMIIKLAKSVQALVKFIKINKFELEYTNECKRNKKDAQIRK